MLFWILFVWIPFGVAILRMVGLPLLVIALAWLGFLVLLAPINYFFGPFIIFGP
jgi:hypothetical protein